ncbi:MAG: alkane 1-monooxygenase [Lutibacter sp.]
MNKYKYLGVFTIAILVYFAFRTNNFLTFTPLIFSFILIPIIELFFKPDSSNLSTLEKENLSSNYYDVLLLLIVPVQIYLLIVFLNSIQEPISNLTYVGRVTAMGIACGIFGINVGHELGHRSNSFFKFSGTILLCTSLETHFIIYHNRGHHYDVATPKDAATARKNEWLYAFWFRSQFGSYLKAWQIQIDLLKKKNNQFFSLKNSMLLYTVFQIIFLVVIFYFYNYFVLLSFITAAIIGILLLETVNYIEHYGLLRKLNETGRYERVKPVHSWNSNHQIGRILLFELSRHSDHHYKASKPYQLLDSLPDSPQMPTGYPGMMLLALFPPIWFKIMNKKLASI